MAQADADLDLLLGALALREGLIGPGALVAAVRAWSDDRSTTVAGRLLDRGDLSPGDVERLRARIDFQADEPGSTRAEATTLAATTDPAEPAPPHDPDATEPAPTGPLVAASTTTAPAQRFRILRHLAKGGLGSVSVALDSELNREVALKQILPGHADDATYQARFLLEAEITGGLEHPGIVPVYGFGSDGEGRPYYAMRLVKGGTLKDAIAAFHEDPALQADPGARSLALRELLRRFGDACNAVDYAHGRGVLHRDLKPSNIAVGKHGETLVLDWGLAKATGRPDLTLGDGEAALVPAVSGDPTRTMVGSAIGTPAFMSPETAAGNLDAVGPRSDVYSLGATLYCILAGRAPFDDPDHRSLLAQVRAGQFPRPRELDPKVDPALEAICLKAMALKAAERYGSAAALVGDLKRWAADEPVLAYPEGRRRRVARWARRHSAPVAGVGALLLTATVALGLTAGIVAQARDELAAGNVELVKARDRADASRNDAQANSGIAIDAVGKLLFAIAQHDLPAIPQVDGLRLRLAEEAATFYRLLHSRDPGSPSLQEYLARSEHQVGELYRFAGRYAEARERYEAARNLLRPEVEAGSPMPKLREMLAVVEMSFGELVRASGGRSEDAEPHFRRAVELASAFSGTPERAWVAAYTNASYADALFAWGRPDQAGPIADLAAERGRAFDATLPAGEFSFLRLILPISTAPRAAILARAGRPEAEPAARELVDTLRRLAALGPELDDVRTLLASALDDLAKVIAADPDRRPGGLALQDEAIVLAQALIARHPSIVFHAPMLATYRVDRAIARTALARPDAALEDLDLARPVLQAEAIRVPGAPTLEALGRATAALARLEAKRGRAAEAGRQFAEAIARHEQALEADPGALANVEAIRRLHDELANLEPRP